MIFDTETARKTSSEDSPSPEISLDPASLVANRGSPYTLQQHRQSISHLPRRKTPSTPPLSKPRNTAPRLRVGDTLPPPRKNPNRSTRDDGAGFRGPNLSPDDTLPVHGDDVEALQPRHESVPDAVDPTEEAARADVVVEVEREGGVAEEQGAGFVAELAARPEEGEAVVAGSEGREERAHGFDSDFLGEDGLVDQEADFRREVEEGEDLFVGLGTFR